MFIDIEGDIYAIQCENVDSFPVQFTHAKTSLSKDDITLSLFLNPYIIR